MSGALGGMSLFDLFRQEMAGQLPLLKQALEEAPGGGDPKAAAAKAIQAAHSIQGAARMAGIPAAEKVAAALEECFERVREGGALPASGSGSALRRAVELLERLAGLAADEAESRTRELEAEADRIAAELAAPAAALPPEAGKTPPSQAPELGDLSILELFKSELENQAAALNSRLLELADDPADPEKIEPVMRAAHSIKGAARMAGLDSLTGLAHKFEDVMVAAQKGALKLGEEALDVCFRAADVFGSLAALPAVEIGQWPEKNAARIGPLVAALEGLLRGETPEPPEAVPAAQEPAAAPETAAPGPSQDGVVRVSAASLNRLMGLAADALVQSRRLDQLRKAIAAERRRQFRISQTVSRVRERAAEMPDGDRLVELVSEAERGLETGLKGTVAFQDKFDEFVRQSTVTSEHLYEEVLASRMRPFADAAPGLRRTVRDTARALGKKARIEIEGVSTPVDRDVLESLRAPLTHILRNAVDHGIEPPDERRAAGKPETGKIRLDVRHHAGSLLVEIADDGRGIDLAALRRRVVERGLASEEMAGGFSENELLEFLFLPGFSTAGAVTEVSGRGVGLDVVQSMVREAGGSVRLSTRKGEGTTVHLHLPVTRSVLRTLIVEIDREPYAFPITSIRSCVSVPVEELESVEGRHYLVYEGNSVGLVSAREVLELGAGLPAGSKVSIVLVGDRDSVYGLEVDRFLGEEDLVLRPLDPRLGKVPNISAAALLEDGGPVLVIDVDDLIQTIEKLLVEGRVFRRRTVREEAKGKRRRTILVVDDSPTVRETERRLLESRGYEVDTAVDGVNAWNAVRLGSYDLVITDVDMPRLNGVELVRRIRQDPRLKATPVMIVSYKDREEDRNAGLEAGASYYLTKSSFQDEAMIDAVADLIGEPGE